jgi:hypothetical protein
VYNERFRPPHADEVWERRQAERILVTYRAVNTPPTAGTSPHRNPASPQLGHPPPPWQPAGAQWCAPAHSLRNQLQTSGSIPTQAPPTVSTTPHHTIPHPTPSWDGLSSPQQCPVGTQQVNSRPRDAWETGPPRESLPHSRGLLVHLGERQVNSREKSALTRTRQLVCGDWPAYGHPEQVYCFDFYFPCVNMCSTIIVGAFVCDFNN